ncbi:hypothetical protein ACWFRC_07515 [Bacillus cereus]
MAIKKVNRPVLEGPISIVNNNTQDINPTKIEITPEDKEDHFSIFRNHNLNIFPKTYIHIENLIPPRIDVPLIKEGINILTITGCKLSEGFSSNYHGKKKLVISFSDEEGQLLSQTYYLGQYNTNFLKFINNILGEIPEGEFCLDSLKGIKIRAFLFHNYTNDGKGYVNIASCEAVPQ